MNIQIIKKQDPLAEAFAKSLKSIESKVERQKLTIVEELLQFMKRNGINRSELAARMQVPNSRITKMLSGDSNLTIDTLVRAGHAVGADLTQTFVPKGSMGHWKAHPKYKRGATNCLDVQFTTKEVKKAATPKISNQKPTSQDAEEAA